jgi:hypothetical protein
LARPFLATVVLLSVLFAGCGPASVGFTFDNRTDAVLCEYPGPQEAAGGRCLVALAPRSETGGGRDCDGIESRPVTVIIAVKADGRQVYRKTASCGEWEDTARRFIIEQEGEEFIVTDSLPGPTPSP